MQHCAGSRSERVHEWKGCHSGACGLGDRHTRATANYLPTSDAVLWLEGFVGIKKERINSNYKLRSIKIIGKELEEFCGFIANIIVKKYFICILLSYLFQISAY